MFSGPENWLKIFLREVEKLKTITDTDVDNFREAYYFSFLEHTAMKYLLAILLMLCLPAVAGAGGKESGEQKDYVRHIGTGSINWTEGRVHSVGSSRMQEMEDRTKSARVAERDALVKARKELLENLLQISVDSSTTIEDLSRENPEIARQLQTLVHHSQIWDTVYYHHPKDEVEVHVFLDLLNRDVQRMLPGRVFVSPEWRKSSGVMMELTAHCPVYLDATGLKVRPSLIPALLDRDGNILYRASVLGESPGANRGHIRYVRVDKDQNITRLYESGPRGLRIEPERTEGRHDSDFVLSWEDSLELQDVMDNIPEECPVIIIMGDE